MIKRPFFGLGMPKLKQSVDFGEEVLEIGLPGRATLPVKGCDVGAIKVKAGSRVKSGQRLQLADGYVVSTVTGTISGFSDYTGYLGETYGFISIDVTEDEWDEGSVEALKVCTYEVGRDCLGSIPGGADFTRFFSSHPPINTALIGGIDQDILVSTQSFLTRTETDALIAGIEYLKKVAKIGRVVLAVAPHQEVEGADAEILRIKPVYPHALPIMIAAEVLGSHYVPGKTLEEMGIGFLSAEAVISLGRVAATGQAPVDKVVTVIGKDNGKVLVKARIGTPVATVLDELGIETGHGDRVVFGGPMKGQAVYSLDLPVMADTDAIMVQDKDQVVLSSDVQCINCGECVRICPTRVPVNMLTRVLGAGLYDDAVSLYDLHSCIECGLCNYVCTAKIPIFQYIMLGKQEFARIAEESNG